MTVGRLLGSGFVDDQGRAHLAEGACSSMSRRMANRASFGAGDISAITSFDIHAKFVYTIAMIKDITLSADEVLIEQARRRAMIGNTTLNELFRVWLARYVAQPATADQYEALMARLSHIKAGGKLSREQMNERRLTVTATA